MKCTKTFLRVEWGGSGAFVAKNSDATSWHELLHHYDRFAPSFVTQLNGPQSPKLYETHRNMIGSNGVDRVRSLRKISKRLRGINFCTSSACFAPSFVSQPNGPNAPKFYEMHQNMSLRSNGVDRVRSLRKIPTPLRGTNFCYSSARFPPSFVSQLNGPKCTKIVRNAPKKFV